MADPYVTTQGDTWDAIAFKLLGDETLLDELVAANPEHVNVLIFPASVVLSVPDVTVPDKKMELPPWM